ncbi:MAG: ribonuclease HI [Minisyncoccia bacterium]
MKLEKYIIFCDGAAKGNPGPGGWGAIVAGDKHIREFGGNHPKTTNNRMELTAAIHALKPLKKGDTGEVHTDSSYVINGITKWVKNWMKNDWKTMQKQPVSNKELWIELEKEAGNKKLKWVLVKGHSGVAGNERVDEIASAFAVGDQVRLYDGPAKLYTINLDGAKTSQSDVRSSKKGKAYSYVSLVAGVIKTHKTWAECEARVKGEHASYKKALSLADEKRIIKEFENK